jgi:hypothetical protein
MGEEKYDATSANMMALLKYGNGMPSYRLEGLQEKLEIPPPASTQMGHRERNGRAARARAGSADPGISAGRNGL